MTCGPNHKLYACEGYGYDEYGICYGDVVVNSGTDFSYLMVECDNIRQDTE
jgi:hypothetical protein